MLSNKKIIVYGGYGHTGRFVLAELIKRGLTPISSGRDLDKLGEISKKYSGLEIRQASVEEPESLDRAIAGAEAVINCAGPFAKTTAPLIEAALRAKIPYLGVAAEVEAVSDAFTLFGDKAEKAGIVILPSVAFYGGLGDLLATTAMGDWQRADEISLAIALSSWKPTLGTRNSGKVSRQRRDDRRIVFTNGQIEYRTDDAPISEWTFPLPFGTQTVVGEFTTADSITIPAHLSVSQLNTYMTLAALKDLSDPDLSPPPAVDESGRSAQTFLVEAIVRLGNAERRAVASGRDIYAVSAPLVVEAAERLINAQNANSGVFAVGEIFDPRDFLNSLNPEYLLLEITQK